MPFTSPFGGLGMTAFNPASSTLPQNLPSKQKAAPETPLPSKPTAPVGAETITALVRPYMLQAHQPEAAAPAPVAQTPTFASMPEMAMPQAYSPTPPMPSFASAPSPYMMGMPTMPQQEQLPRRLNPNRLVFV